MVIAQTKMIAEEMQRNRLCDQRDVEVKRRSLRFHSGLCRRKHRGDEFYISYNLLLEKCSFVGHFQSPGLYLYLNS